MNGETFSWAAIWRGAVLGLAIVLPLVIAVNVVGYYIDRSTTRTSIDTAFVLLLFGAYFAAGWRAGRSAPGAPLSNGILAAVGTLAVALPVVQLLRVVRGDGVSLRIGTVFGQLVLAAFIGMLAAWAAARRSGASPTPTE